MPLLVFVALNHPGQCFLSCLCVEFSKKIFISLSLIFNGFVLIRYFLAIFCLCFLLCRDWGGIFLIRKKSKIF